MKIVLLGSGNVATHLGRALKLAGQNIVQVWSRDISHAEDLAGAIASKAVTPEFDDIDKKADLYIIAVKDSAIADVAARLNVKDRLIVHTSGSTSLDVLEGASDRTGVFYPLQTFSKAKVVDFRQVPIAIEATNADHLQAIRAVADRLSEKVIEMTSAQRKALHVAAVFACNFTNDFYSISKQLLEGNGLDFEPMRPLIAETADKIRLNDPEKVQTGPAVRHDSEIIKVHLEMLNSRPELRDLYEKLSQSIVNLHKPQQG